jgi:tetratricopeptide (TPR) repeat protein
MKKFFILFVLMILMTARGVPESRKILWDDSHVIRPAQVKQIGFMAPVPFPKNFISGLGYIIDYNEGNELTYKTIEGYDVLVEWVPFTLLTPQEVEAVKRFVRNGGGLILFGEYATTLYGGIAGTSNREGFNSLSDAFGVEYVNHYFYGEYLTWSNHPLTSSMKELLLTHFGVLQSFSPDFRPVITTEYDQTVVGVMTYGKGRAVFSTDAFLDEHANSDALLLASNAFAWLCEPGGPFRHAQKVRQEASGFLYGGIELFTTGKYEEAKQRLYESQRLYRTLGEIDDSDVGEKVSMADRFLKRCDTAQKGESLFLSGQTLLQEGEYEKAHEALVQASLLFEEAGVAKVSEARLLVQKCEEAQSELERKKAQEEKQKLAQMNSTTLPPPAPPSHAGDAYVFVAIGATLAILFVFIVKSFERKEEAQVSTEKKEEAAGEMGAEEKREEKMAEGEIEKEGKGEKVKEISGKKREEETHESIQEDRIPMEAKEGSVESKFEKEEKESKGGEKNGEAQ